MIFHHAGQILLLNLGLGTIAPTRCVCLRERRGPIGPPALPYLNEKRVCFKREESGNYAIF